MPFFSEKKIKFLVPRLALSSTGRKLYPIRQFRVCTIDIIDQKKVFSKALEPMNRFFIHFFFFW